MCRVLLVSKAAQYACMFVRNSDPQHWSGGTLKSLGLRPAGAPLPTARYRPAHYCFRDYLGLGLGLGLGLPNPNPNPTALHTVSATTLPMVLLVLTSNLLKR